MKATKQMKCCVCEIEIDNGMDYHNPDPLGESNDVCCTYCNITKVIPKRLEKPIPMSEQDNAGGERINVENLSEPIKDLLK
jgi:hypothetical protein